MNNKYINILYILIYTTISSFLLIYSNCNNDIELNEGSNSAADIVNAYSNINDKPNIIKVLKLHKQKVNEMIKYLNEINRINAISEDNKKKFTKKVPKLIYNILYLYNLDTIKKLKTKSVTSGLLLIIVKDTEDALPKKDRSIHQSFFYTSLLEFNRLLNRYQCIVSMMKTSTSPQCSSIDLSANQSKLKESIDSIDQLTKNIKIYKVQ